MKSKSLKLVIQKAKYILNTVSTWIEFPFFKLLHQKQIKRIPIIINNRNHLKYLERLIESLKIRGFTNIFILDNDSNYERLLEYYKDCPHRIFKLDKNIGYKALWSTEFFKNFENDYYVYTDSDLEIAEECPDDFLLFFFYLHKKYSFVGKVGFGLKFDDLPEYYINSKEVKDWESSLISKARRLEKMAFLIQIDTTFALYKPGMKGEAHTMSCIRTGYPFLMHHLPWYENSDNLDDEQKFYYKNAETSTHWTKISKQKLNH